MRGEGRSEEERGGERKIEKERRREVRVYERRVMQRSQFHTGQSEPRHYYANPTLLRHYDTVSQVRIARACNIRCVTHKIGCASLLAPGPCRVNTRRKDRGGVSVCPPTWEDDSK